MLNKVKLGIGVAIAALSVVATAPDASAAAVAPARGPVQVAVPASRINAPAAISPSFTDVTYVFSTEWQFQTWTVDVYWGFDYNPATNHLAAYALMFDNVGAVHLQAEPLNLGDLNGLLASTTANNQAGFLEIDTPVVGCHKPNGVYLSNLHYSIRWPDGTLTSDQQTGQLQAGASTICV